MLKKESLRKADVISSIILIILGIYVIKEALKMPATGLPGTVEQEFYLAPGFFPIIVAIVLIIMGLFLLINGIRSGGRISKDDLRKFVKIFTSKNAIRSIVITALIIIYTIILLGRIPFFWATFIFLAGSMFFLKAGSWWSILLISTIGSLIIQYCFGTLARIPLP